MLTKSERLYLKAVRSRLEIMLFILVIVMLIHIPLLQRFQESRMLLP